VSSILLYLFGLLRIIKLLIARTSNFWKNANAKIDGAHYFVKSLLNDNASRANDDHRYMRESELIEWSAWTYPSWYDGKAGSDK